MAKLTREQELERKKKLDEMKRDFEIVENIKDEDESKDARNKAKNFKYKNAYAPTWEFKKFFLERCKEREEISYFRLRDIYRLMFKIGKWENRYEKDAYDFEYDELVGMLREFNATSYSSLITQKSNLEYYLQFAKMKNQGKPKDSAIININAEELRGMVNHIGYTSKFITREELEEGRTKLVNPHDQALISLIFEGIRGNHCDDIINIKWKEVNWENNTIKVNDRVIDVNEDLMEIIYKMNEEDNYQVKNGDYVRGERISKNGTAMSVGRATGDREILSKNESEYLFRPIREKDTNLGRLTYQTIQRRIKDILVAVYNRPTISMTTIYTSGLIDRAIDYSENVIGGEMRNTDFQKWLRDNNERVNIQDTFKAYKKFYHEKLGLSQEDEENDDDEMSYED